MSSCDSCTACCTILGVPEIEKTRGVMCEHVRDGGCSLHPARGGTEQPVSCSMFVCGWLASQSLPRHSMPPTMRPDRCGVVIGPIDEEDPKRLYINVDPTRPEAWTDTEVLCWLEKYLNNGVDVILCVGDASAPLRRKQQWTASGG
jgi:hypothetical protein